MEVTVITLTKYFLVYLNKANVCKSVISSINLYEIVAHHTVLSPVTGSSCSSKKEELFIASNEL